MCRILSKFKSTIVMVLQVMKWNISTDKAGEYPQWAESAIKRTLTTKVKEFRAFRPVTGDTQVACTYQFEDLESWTAWQGTEEVQTE